jgi:hypothetical protein
MCAGKQIRARKLGSNALSDKYMLLTPVEERFQDLALFCAHTGFSNVRTTRKTMDIDILPIFRSLWEVSRFLSQNRETTNSVTCGLAVQSLDLAWRLFPQEQQTLWFIQSEARFILYIRKGLSNSSLDILTDEDEDLVGSVLQTTFRPHPIALSIDAFLNKQDAAQPCLPIYNTLRIMVPHYLIVHGLSRNSIGNRMNKLRKDGNVCGKHIY